MLSFGEIYRFFEICELRFRLSVFLKKNRNFWSLTDFVGNLQRSKNFPTGNVKFCFVVNWFNFQWQEFHHGIDFEFFSSQEYEMQHLVKNKKKFLQGTFKTASEVLTKILTKILTRMSCQGSSNFVISTRLAKIFCKLLLTIFLQQLKFATIL